jgi:hypothetical protein
LSKPEYDFEPLLGMRFNELVRELVTVQQQLANLYGEVAFLKAQEGRGVKERLPERVQLEGTVAALTEEKWLILKLMEVIRDATDVLSIQDAEYERSGSPA